MKGMVRFHPFEFNSVLPSRDRRRYSSGPHCLSFVPFSVLFVCCSTEPNLETSCVKSNR